jgi:hypothetical protein
MLRVAFWSLLTAVALVCFVSCVAQGAALQPVAEAPGGFQIAGGPAPLVAKGKPVDATGVAALAGKPDGYDVLVDGLSLFGMDYAHKVGRREPLRGVAADLSDWGKAPACPPDQVLIDPRSGRMRFFSGHDPASFQSRVVARFRGTHGDAAFARWRGDIFFLSHWESSYHVWAYDARNPAVPAKIGELPVGNFAHGFVLLDSGWALMGTTGKGIMLLDLRDPREMKVVKRLLPGHDWVDSITPRYVAAWRMPDGVRDDPRGPRVFDVSKLPGDWVEVTESVKPEVRRYLSERVDLTALDGPTCFRSGDQSLAFINLKGEPAAWRIVQTVKLPDLPGPPDRWTRIRLQPQVPGKRFVLLYPVAGGGSRLQVLDVSKGKAEFLPPLKVGTEKGTLILQNG